MGNLEEGLYTSLVALRDVEGVAACERHMFVFPSDVRTLTEDFQGSGIKTLRVGDVLLVCRP